MGLDTDITLKNFDPEQARAPYLTSPRSIDVCRKLGVEPKELVKRNAKYYHRAGESETMADKRYKQFEHLRKRKLDTARREYHMVLNGAGDDLGTDARHGHSDVVDATSTAVAREKRQMEKMQRRQYSEMQQMLAFQLHQAKMAQENEKKAADGKQREMDKAARAAQKKLEWDAIMRQKTLEKAEYEKTQEQERNRLARREMALEQQRAEAQKVEAIAREKAAREKEIERAQKHEEHRKKTEDMLQMQQDQVLAREKVLNKRDLIRRQRLEQQRKKKMEDVAAKQAETNARVSAALDTKVEMVEAQRADFAKKQEESEKRRRQYDQQKQEEIERERQAAEQKAAEIAKVQAHMEYIEQSRRDELLRREAQINERLEHREIEKHFEQEERVKQEIEKSVNRNRIYAQMVGMQEQRAQSILREREQKDVLSRAAISKREGKRSEKFELGKVRQEALEDALTRKDRRDEYQKDKLRKQIAKDQERMDAMKSQKDEILKQRQMARIQMKTEREKILREFDQMKISNKMPKQMMKQMAPPAPPPPVPVVVTQTRGSQSARPASASRSRPAAAATQPPRRPAQQREHKVRPATAGGNPASRRPSATGRVRPVKKKPAAPKPAAKLADTAAPKLAEKSAPADANQQADAVQQLEVIRRRQNEHLLQVLEEEQSLEEQREDMMRQVDEGSERKRLEKIFGVERAKASERIMRITEDHERVLQAKIKELKL